MPRMPALALLALVLAAAGCGADTEDGGGTDATTEVRATVAKFGVATRTHDWQTICDALLSPALVAKIEDVGLPCETAVEKGLGDVKDPTLQITDVSLSGTRALVSIHTTASGQQASDDALQLVKEDGQWRIAALAAPKGGGGSSSAPSTTATAPTVTAGTVTAPTVTTETTSTSGSKTTRTTKSSSKTRTATTKR